MKLLFFNLNAEEHFVPLLIKKNKGKLLYKIENYQVKCSQYLQNKCIKVNFVGKQSAKF